ncbi:Cytochrome c oxidase subunit 1 [bacterium HR21]|nr:Cytochrome c oxidase subunit 1 [bacterium HR21]
MYRAPIFRMCDITGLQVDRTAERLIRLNAVFAALALLVAVIGALLLVLTRWQSVHLLPAQWYYRILTLHGLNTLIFWIVFFEVAGLYFGSTIVLSAPFCAPRVGWLALLLMVAGFLLADVMVLAGYADVLMTSYVPLQAHWLYYLGIILFAVGALIAVFLFFGNLMVARRAGTYGGTLPLFTYGLAAAAIIAVITLVSGAIIYVPTFLWSLGVIPRVDPALYKLVWWGLGHPAQQINVSAMVSVWYLAAYLTTGGVSVNERVSRIAFVLYILFICLASAHHLLVDPAVSSVWKVWNTSYAMYLAVLASMIHAFAVPAAIEAAQRARGYTRGLFQWLAKAPWGNPTFSATVLSIIGFGFIGGITGVIYGMEQTNIIVHNTLAIPGHFKGTVVLGTSLAFMGITYYLIPLVFRRRIVGLGLARWQPWIFAVGVALLAIAMVGLGVLGVPRRHWDVTFSGAPFRHSFPAIAGVLWVIFGLGGLLAVGGVLLWLGIVVLSVFFGPRMEGPHDMQLPLAQPVPLQHNPDGKKFVAPGTLVATLVFLATFLVFFWLNWKWLAATWGVR